MMSKKQWSDLLPGAKVKTLRPTWNEAKSQLIDTWHFGTVIRMNSNGAQALVKWESGSEVWHGRTSLDLT